MEYIIIPTEVFEQADMEFAKKLGLDNPRKNVGGTEVLMHIESYRRLFPMATYCQRLPFPIYDSDTKEFVSLIKSDSWTPQNENNSSVCGG